MQFKSTLTYPNIHNIKMKNSIKPMKPVIINYQKNPQKPTNYIWNVKIDRYLSKSWCSFLHVGHWSNLETITRKLLQTPAQKKKKRVQNKISRHIKWDPEKLVGPSSWYVLGCETQIKKRTLEVERSLKEEQTFLLGNTVEFLIRFLTSAVPLLNSFGNDLFNCLIIFLSVIIIKPLG